MKKKNKDLKVLLSVGGTLATNSTLFRRVAGHAAKTGAFLGSAGYFLKTYHFDGIDIDWQYPEESDMVSSKLHNFDHHHYLLQFSVFYLFGNNFSYYLCILSKVFQQYFLFLLVTNNNNLSNLKPFYFLNGFLASASYLCPSFTDLRQFS